ncbi:MAG: histidine kinase N-terminal 7TM domain-containing protein, partial [Halobacteriaceae archaeon]
MQINPTIIFSFAAATISLGAIALTRKHWDVKGMPAIAGFNAAVVIWTGGNAAQLAVTSLEAKVFWINVQYIGIAAL